jgi:NAD-dependent dihydropyrimidine dehydrogenase PreA subunit
VTHVIAKPCIGVKDKTCTEVCPMDCIHGTQEDNMLFIDPADCIDCGACRPACPVGAIFPENEVPEKWRQFIGINADYYRDKK